MYLCIEEHLVRKFGNILRFIGDLIAINDGNQFENRYNEIHPPELILKRKTLHTQRPLFYTFISI